MTWENWAIAIGLGARLMVMFFAMELLYASARRDLGHNVGKEPGPHPTASRG